MTPKAPVAGDRSRLHTLLRRWPVLVGLLAATSQVLTGADRATVAIVVGVAVTCYLAAAAFGRPWVAWAAIPGCVLATLVGDLVGVESLTALAVLAAALVVVGLVTRASRAALTVETVGVLVYGGLAALGLAIAPTAGLVLVAAVLVAHAGWDAVHLRRRAVVAPSLAEFCIALDVPLGIAVIVALLTT